LSTLDFFYEKDWQPFDHGLGFRSYPIQTSFESLSPW
jgi:hypothetical protein